jgi:hypothetical protein
VIAATGLASVAFMAAGLWLFGVTRAAAAVLATTRTTAATMRDPSLDDLAREKAAQRASLTLMAGFGSIVVRTALALGAALIPVWIASRQGLASAGSVFHFLSRWDVLLFTTAAMIGGYLLAVRPWRTN